jgi:hypothetical protein
VQEKPTGLTQEPSPAPVLFFSQNSFTTQQQLLKQNKKKQMKKSLLTILALTAALVPAQAQLGTASIA